MGPDRRSGGGGCSMNISARGASKLSISTQDRNVLGITYLRFSESYH